MEVAAPVRVGSSTELLEAVLGKAADAPLCFTCGTKMRPAGSCYVCEGCGSTQRLQLTPRRARSWVAPRAATKG